MVGISRATAQLLLAEAAQRPFRGCVVILGRQDIHFTWLQFRSWADAQGVQLRFPTSIRPHANPQLAARGYPSDATILTALGFDRIVSVDYSAYEGVDYLLDLNSGETPTGLLHSCDVVLNLGTLEHVFHLPNSLAHVHRMLRCGGRAIHSFPTHNFVEHGFYSLSPTLPTDYYRANRYHTHHVWLVRYDKPTVDSGVDVFDYLQPNALSCEVGSLDARAWATWAVVEKRPESVCDEIPQQSFYERTWNASPSQAKPTFAAPSVQGRAEQLRAYAIRCGFGVRLVDWLVTRWRAVRKVWNISRHGAPWRKIARFS